MWPSDPNGNELWSAFVIGGMAYLASGGVVLVARWMLRELSGMWRRLMRPRL